MNSDQEKFYELSYYTLAHPDPAFIHQHVVDAYGAQHANENSKPVAVYFTLMGLYLYLEKNYTGKEVQLAHMKVAKTKKEWPQFDLPNDRGEVTVSDVLNAPPGEARDEMIRRWCVSVWNAYKQVHEKVQSSTKKDLPDIHNL
jgi:hypothetical protein